VILTLAPVLFIALAIPLMLGIVPRNWFYGVRTPRTLASAESWYPASRIGGVILLAIGVVWLVARSI
jgi:uncharacterized membrane protein